MSSLERLAELIRARNANEVEIAQITSRPAQIGHLGEFIAGEVFAITLERSASAKALGGWFSAGPFEVRSVNIK